jgi:tetratricopeptide (TPR) repeat protein
VEEGAALAAYARALAADSFGAQRQALDGYSEALDLAPDNDVLAARALGEALTSGDRPLAVRAAGILDRAGKAGTEGRLILLADAVRRRDWRAAALRADQMAEDKVFVFTAPLLSAWIRVGSGKGDPLAPIAAASDDPLATAYGADQKPLLLLAAGRTREGLAALAPSLGKGDAREVRLRTAAAGLLARHGRRKEALALLTGQSELLTRARGRLERRRPLIAGDVAAWGVSSFLVRIAADLRGQEVPALALNFARVATFAAPRNSEAWLAVGEILSGRGEEAAALAALAPVPADDVLAPAATDFRLSLLAEAGDGDTAIVEARRAAEADPTSATAWARLADLLSRLERHKEAADAYAAALKAVAGGSVADRAEWGLWLQAGAALTEAGDWNAGKAAVERAYKLAPQQPVVLNFLGYSQLERRENLDEAEGLIRLASKLDPDNAAITDSLGWAHYVRGDHAKAVELLERAAKSEPADAAINEHLGDAYYTAGRRFEARYAWRAALVYADDAAAERLRAKVDRGLSPDLAAP